MIRYSILVLSLLTFLPGCAQDVPISRRDLEYARQDLELEHRKYKTFVGTQEREAVNNQISDHRTDHTKLYLFDNRMDSTTQESRFPIMPIDDTARTKQINELIDSQLHKSQDSSLSK